MTSLGVKTRTGEGRKHREVSTWQKSTQRSIRRFQPSSTQSVSHCAPHHGPALVPQLAQSLLPCREMANDPGQYTSIPRPTLPPFTLTLHPNKGSLNMLGDPSPFFYLRVWVFSCLSRFCDVILGIKAQCWPPGLQLKRREKKLCIHGQKSS